MVARGLEQLGVPPKWAAVAGMAGLLRRGTRSSSVSTRSVSGRDGASIAHRRRRGSRAENRGAANLENALKQHCITVERQVRYSTDEGDTIIDFVLKTHGGERILRLIEHKTPLGSWHGKQRQRQTLAAATEKVPIDIMRTAPTTGNSTVNGMKFEEYVRTLLRETRRRK
jgi:hypothetical protein